MGHGADGRSGNCHTCRHRNRRGKRVVVMHVHADMVVRIDVDVRVAIDVGIDVRVAIDVRVGVVVDVLLALLDTKNMC